MAKAKTLVLLFTLILLLFTIVWFLYPCQHSSLAVDFHGLERVFSCLDHSQAPPFSYGNRVDFEIFLSEKALDLSHGSDVIDGSKFFDAKHDSDNSNYIEEAQVAQSNYGAIIEESQMEENSDIIEEKSSIIEDSAEYYRSIDLENLHTEMYLNMSANKTEDNTSVILSKKNFSKFVLINKYAAVLFYSSCSQWSWNPSFDFIQASAMMEGKVIFAKLDTCNEMELAKKNKFGRYFTLYFFIEGVHMHTFRQCCRRDEVVSWLKEKMNGGVHTITKPSMAEDILRADSMVILGFFDNLESRESMEFAAASMMLKNVIFYQTTSRFILEILHLNSEDKGPSLFMLRKDAERFMKFEGSFNRAEIAEFVSKNKFPLVTIFSQHNYFEIFQNSIKQLWIFAMENDSETLMPILKEAANAFNGKILFVYIKMDHSHKIARGLYYATGSAGNEPKVLAVSRTDRARIYAMNGELSLSDFKIYGENLIQGKQFGKPIKESKFLVRALFSWPEHTKMDTNDEELKSFKVLPGMEFESKRKGTLLFTNKMQRVIESVEPERPMAIDETVSKQELDNSVFRQPGLSVVWDDRRLKRSPFDLPVKYTCILTLKPEKHLDSSEIAKFDYVKEMEKEMEDI